MNERWSFNAALVRFRKHWEPVPGVRSFYLRYSLAALSLFLPAAQASFGQGSIDLPTRRVDLMEALRSTLEQHPEIQLQQQQVEINRGALLAAAAPFDFLWNAGIQHARQVTPLTQMQQLSASAAGIDVDNLVAQNTAVNAGTQLLRRNGLTFASALNLNRTLDNFSNLTGLNQMTMAFSVNLPLLKGRGKEAVAAQEISARYNVEAGLFDVNQEIAQLLASTAVQYWNVVAAERALEIERASEERGLSYEQDVSALIEADRVPRGEINQLRANLAQRKANLMSSEQSLITARLNLALAMGLRASDVAMMPLTTDALPDWNGPAPSITPALMQSFVSKALARRADLMADEKRIQAAEALLPAARNQLRRQLDVSLSAGYSGLLENQNIFATFGAPFRNPAGPNATASIRYSFPRENSAARGALIEAEASHRQTLLTRANTERTIASNVATAMTALVKSIARLQEDREAVKYYQLALTGEQDKYHLGIGSLVDVLTIEDRLTLATSDEVSAQLDYAVAVENLRFATGTVIDPNAQTHTLERRIFVTPPFDWEGSRP